MSEAIVVRGLTKHYGGKTVVDHLDLSVRSGTVFGLLGANGAGKSTAIECMLGTRRADAGTVRLLGQDPKKHRRTLFERIGVQFQEGDYQKEIKVSELCEETACLYRDPADWRALCEQFGIGDKANTPVKGLSGGECQRLFIVLALIVVLVFLRFVPVGLWITSLAAGVHVSIGSLAGMRLRRIQPKLLRQLRTTIDDAMDTAGLPLLGVVPEDPQVMLSANLGRPLILGGRQGAANACLNIAKRLEGRRVPIMRIR